MEAKQTKHAKAASYMPYYTPKCTCVYLTQRGIGNVLCAFCRAAAAKARSAK
jgi:hypothetical protein